MKLNKEELDILGEIEIGEWKSSKENLDIYKTSAENHFKKK